MARRQHPSDCDAEGGPSGAGPGSGLPTWCRETRSPTGTTESAVGGVMGKRSVRGGWGDSRGQLAQQGQERPEEADWEGWAPASRDPGSRGFEQGWPLQGRCH